MQRLKLLFISCLVIFGIATLFPQTALAQTAGGEVQQISNFIKSLIQVVASLAGLIATGFFVLGGLSYITSSGNPVALQKAKRTIVFSGVGLMIVIASFALTDIITDLATKSFGV